MHFHAAELRAGVPPHDLGGQAALRYPSDQPTFANVECAVDAVTSTVLEDLGTAAELHLQSALLVELDLEREQSRGGAAASWSGPNGTTTWSVRACNCTDGTIAEILAAELE